jgi:hypothetical protein
VRGLHRAFPPSDPPVYSRPQVKPPCGICSFTTMTMSLFLHAVLSTYGVVLVHLHPNSVIALAIFQHLCEAHVGVRLLVAGVSSSVRFHRRTPLGASCLEIVGSNEIRLCAPIFFLIVWFQRRLCEALLSVAIIGHVFDIQW